MIHVPLGIVTKFQEDTIKTVWLRERKCLTAGQPIRRRCSQRTSHLTQYWQIQTIPMISLLKH